MSTSFTDYVNSNEAVVQLLQLRMKKRVPGREMTELEAWQYVCWGLNELLAMLCSAAPTVSKMANIFQPIIAQTNAGKWEAQHTGKFPPPMEGEVHFESPEAMEIAKAAWKADLDQQLKANGHTTDTTQDDHRGGTYL